MELKKTFLLAFEPWDAKLFMILSYHPAYINNL